MDKNNINVEKNEDKLILYCARTYLDPKIEKKIKNITKNDLNWKYMIISACKNRVIPLFYSNISNLCPEEVPSNYLNILRDYYNRNAKKNLFLTSELFNILKIFETNKINSISHKGPVLAHLAYGNLALRQYHGFEIIINEENAKKAKDLLLLNGYKLKFQPPTNYENNYIRSVKEYLFFNPKSHTNIIIRWNYFKNFFSSPKDITNILDFDNTKLIKMGDNNVFIIDNEDLLLVLSLENVKKQWKRLKYLCDIAGIIQKNNIDWEKLLGKSREYRLEKILFTNLYLINKLFNINLPSQIVSEICSDFDIEHNSIKIEQNFFIKTDNLIKRLEKKNEDPFIRFKLRENSLDGIKDFFKVMVSSRKYKMEYESSLNGKKEVFSRPIYFFKRAIFGEYPPIILPMPYVVTPTKIVKKMLKIAEINSDDVIYDLGCGDGRFVITAAKEYGIRGVGIDNDPKRIMESKENAKKEGVQNLTTFLHNDIMKADISEATLITIYMLPMINRTLKSVLQRKLKPKTRIITREFSMGDWDPIRTELIPYKKNIIPIYLYEI